MLVKLEAYPALLVENVCLWRTRLAIVGDVEFLANIYLGPMQKLAADFPSLTTKDKFPRANHSSRGAQKPMRVNLKLVWAEFSTLS